MRFIVLLTLLVLVSCSSAKRRAIELSEKGQYEEAIVQWEKALKDDPKDAEALEGLKKSQEMAINNRLVQLRNFRNSNEHARALQALKEIVDLEKKWDYKLDVNSASFQGKEAALLWNPFKTEVKARIQKGHALSAAALYEDFHDIFAFAPKGELEAERKKIFSAGKKSCRAFKDSAKYPYLTSFHNRYCHYFGIDRKAKVVYSNILYSHYKINYNLNGTTEESKFTLLSKMSSAFRDTPWYDKSSSQEIPLSVSGKLDRKHDKENILQHHEYYEDEDYTVHESVKKSRLNHETGRWEDYYEVEPVTKTHSVRKEISYWATRLSQEITFRFKADFDLLKKVESIGLEKDFEEEIIVHDENRPSIGLHAKEGKLQSPATLWEKYTDEVAAMTKAKLLQVWEKEYCVLPEMRTFASVAESVLRCRKSPAMKTGEYVNTWFQNNYGASNAVAEKVLGDF